MSADKKIGLEIGMGWEKWHSEYNHNVRFSSLRMAERFHLWKQDWERQKKEANDGLVPPPA